MKRPHRLARPLCANYERKKNQLNEELVYLWAGTAVVSVPLPFVAAANGYGSGGKTLAFVSPTALLA